MLRVISELRKIGLKMAHCRICRKAMILIPQGTLYCGQNDELAATITMHMYMADTAPFIKGLASC